MALVQGTPEQGSKAAPGSSREGKSHFRPDIEGLRAVAIGAVLFAHAGIAAAAGGYVGVDVFFVISGYLITGLLVREMERKGKVDLLGFYGRRAKRLLPAAVTVLIAIVIGSELLFSPLRAEVVARDVIASALYFVNWRFIAQSTDYFGESDAVSPVQHYWSLSIEEQFYFIWPALLLGATWWWRSRGGSLRPALWAVMAVVGVGSLTYSILYTAELPSAAYFSTFTRAWEFALGGALALLALRRLPTFVAAALAAGGLVAIAIATLSYTDTTAFPGVAALLPGLGAGAIILAGSGGVLTAPSRLLCLAPVRYVGRISYSWYLWHWPAVIFAESQAGGLALAQNVAVIVVSGIPAALTYHFVEDPLRRSRWLSLQPKRALALGSSCMCVGVLGALLVLAAQPSFSTAPATEVKGAKALDEEPEPQERAGALRPNPEEAGKDRGRMFDDGCLVDPTETRSGECTYGKRDAKKTVVLFGDSHALHFFPALEPITRERGWKLVGLTKAGCPPIAASVWNPKLNRDYRECDQWREDTLERIEREDPDLIVVSSASYYTTTSNGKRIEDEEENDKRLLDGYIDVLERLEDTGARVALIRDVPHAPHDIPDCVSKSLDNLRACAFPESEARNAGEGFDVEAARRTKGVKPVDLMPALCPKGTCRAVIGDAITIRGTNHLTATFARTLSPRLKAQLRRAWD